MTKSIDKLIETVEEHGAYLQSENLASIYANSDPFKLELLPAVAAALEEVVPTIKAFHTVDPDGAKKGTKFVHYTSIGTLFQILSAVDRHAGSIKKRTGTLRLYDSIHLNDPDEGQYIFRNIATEAKYSWMERPLEELFSDKSKIGRAENAYITSLIVGREVEDNLVFWAYLWL